MRAVQWLSLLGSFIAVAIITSACAGKPSDQQIEAAIKREHRDLIRVAKVVKGTEEIEKHPLTERIVYMLFYEAEIEWLEPVKVTRGYGAFLPEISRQGERSLRIGRDYRKGHREHIAGLVCFDKTSEGWKHRGPRTVLLGCG